jgi:hypothetical protein
MHLASDRLKGLLQLLLHEFDVLLHHFLYECVVDRATNTALLALDLSWFYWLQRWLLSLDGRCVELGGLVLAGKGVTEINNKLF